MSNHSPSLWAGAAAGASVPLLYLTWSAYLVPLTAAGLMLGWAAAWLSRTHLAQLRVSSDTWSGALQGAVAGCLAGLSSWATFSLFYWILRLTHGY